MDKIVEFVNKKVLKKKEEPPKIDIDKTNFITIIAFGDKWFRMERYDHRKRNKT